MTSYLLQFVLDIFTEALLVDQIKLEKKHLDYCNKSDQRIAVIATSCGVLAIAFWGLLALLGRLTEKVPALQLLFMCFLISTLILFVKRILNGQKVFSSPSLSAKQWVIGTGCLFGYHLGFFVALKLAPAIEVTLINYLWPLLLALMLAISTKNKSRIIKAALGGLLGFIGIIVLMSDKLGDVFNQASLSTENYYGYLIALVCAFVWSGYSMFLSKSPGKTEDMGWLSLAVAILALLAHYFLETAVWDLSITEWSGVVLLGLGPVGGSFYFWDHGLKQGNQTLLASLSFTTPLIGAGALIIFGLSDWTLNIMIALLFVLAGAVISNSRKKNKVATVENLAKAAIP